MKIDILTLFPSMFDGFLKESIIKRAIERKLVDIHIINFRDFSVLNNNQVDDTPYGGGGGMVLRPEPLISAIEKLKTKDSKVILMCPQGVPYKQEKANSLKNEKHLILVCGHYEGFDERIRFFVDEEISIGDYVLTGGELPAMVLIDSVSRYVEGVLKEDSVQEESFSNGFLEYPQYTRPEIFRDKKVPEILLSGHHENIKKWRQERSLEITKLKRPDLLEKSEKTDN